MAHLKTPSSYYSFLLSVVSTPSRSELQGCWELCRLHNNIGFWVVWLPVAWSITMVYHAEPKINSISALCRAAAYVPMCLGIKSLIMTIDDLLDYDIDAKVERTKNRPIPRGAISVTRAWIFFFLQIIIGVSLAIRFLSPQALVVSMTVWPLYLLYPTCKRWMSFAPIPLGLMFKVGVFMGWADLNRGDISWAVLVPTYIGACCWTITYETIYQHMDKADDVRIGLHSSALFLRQATIPVCTFTAILFFTLLAYGGFLNGQGIPFYTAVGVACAILFSRLLQTNVDVPEDCKAFFLQTPRIGQIILAGLVVDAIHQRLIRGIVL